MCNFFVCNCWLHFQVFSSIYYINCFAIMKNPTPRMLTCVDENGVFSNVQSS